MYVLSRNKKNIKSFLSENFPFLVVKFSIYLNRLVCVMMIIQMPHTTPQPHEQIRAVTEKHALEWSLGKLLSSIIQFYSNLAHKGNPF